MDSVKLITALLLASVPLEGVAVVLKPYSAASILTVPTPPLPPVVNVTLLPAITLNEPVCVPPVVATAILTFASVVEPVGRPALVSTLLIPVAGLICTH